MKTIEYKLKRRLHETYFIEPNDLGIDWLTKIYKTITAPLKTIPIIYIIPLSIILGVAIFLLLNQLIVKLVTILQYGF